MTAPAPEQYRALADDVQHTVDNGYEFAPENVVAALRAAADQLEGVRQYVVNGEYEHDEGGRFVWAHSLRQLLGLPAPDTTPQENHDD